MERTRDDYEARARAVKPRRAFRDGGWGRLGHDLTIGDDCWIWEGALTTDGYGHLLWRGKIRLVHRVVYELLVGPIPESLTLDHLCRVRSCANPAHVEPVTHRVNILRGEGIAALHARQTHCIHGHEFTPENTARTKGGQRQCRECHRIANRRRRGGREMNEHEARARSIKAHKLARVARRVLNQPGVTLASMAEAPEEFRARVATLAKTRPPSEQTWELVMAMLAEDR